MVRSKLPSNPSCYEAVKRISCVATFAVCPDYEEASSSYLPPCRLQCTQIEAICDAKGGVQIPSGIDIDSSTYYFCNHLPEMNCALNLPQGYFAITPRQGDYEYIGMIYIILFVFWFGFAIYWNFAVYVQYQENCALICRLVSIVPVIKTVVMIIGIAFWVTCHKWQMCSFWLQVALVNTHLIYETAIMVSLLLCAHGWSITRFELDGHEWRGVVVMMTMFYIVNSVILVIQATTKDYSNVVIANAVVYAVSYLYIVSNGVIQVRRVNRHVKMLQPNMAPEFTAPLKLKREMFIVFMLMTFLSIVAEVTTQSITASTHGVGPFIATYEIGNFIAIAVIGYYFRPREYSPFFFMEPQLSPHRIAGNGDQDDDRLLTVIKAVKSGVNNSEVALNPLVFASPSMRNNPCQTLQQRVLSMGSSMMVLQNINEDISIGVCSSVGERASLRDLENGGGRKQHKQQKQSKQKVQQNRGSNPTTNTTNTNIGNNDDNCNDTAGNSSNSQLELTRTGEVSIQRAPVTTVTTVTI